MPRLPSLPSLPRLRQPPRPLLDVVNLGSSGHSGHSPEAPTRWSPMSPSTPNSNVSADQANLADPANEANPADFSRARSAAVGALTGAAVGAYRASTVNEDQLIQRERRRRANHDPRLPPLTPEKEAAFIKATKLMFIAGVASAGGAVGLQYATDVNANNSAVKRGNAPKSGFRRYNEAVLAGGAGLFVGLVAGAKATGLKADFGTGKAAKRSREPAWSRLPRPYV